MISINCGLYLPDNLKPLMNKAVFPRVTLHWEMGFMKNENIIEKYLDDEERNDHVGYWDPIGLKKLLSNKNFLLNVTLKFVVEFPGDDQQLPGENSNLLTKLTSESKISEPEEKSELSYASESENNSKLNHDSDPEDHESKPELVTQIEQILSTNQKNSVQLCSEGIGGTYFIQNEQGHKLAVFKPTDEEPGAEFNPKEPQPNPLLPPGGGSIREVAAYLLDNGFAGVPETYLLSGIQHCSFNSPHPKSGSLQRYIENIENNDMSSSRFAVEDVHKMGILDIRLFNMDRNSENYLILNSVNPKLVPIDHSYILPPSLSFVWFEWLYWKQAKQPFSKEHLNYIENLDIQKDSEILSGLGFEPESIRTMKISTTLLKIAAVKFGYNLFQIGLILSRKKLNEESELERMVEKAESLTTCPDQFLDVLTKIITEELQNK
jgi:hypothetical protein